MSYHYNDRMEVVTDEDTIRAAARLVGAVEASAAYGINMEPKVIQDYLERLRESGKQLNQHLQPKER
jgi:hypothetical protein